MTNLTELGSWAGTGELLASEFSKFVSDSGLNESMRYKRPTPMIAPHLAVQSIMTALQMNDYPEEDAGARTAYLFSKPHDCENLIAGQVCICCLCRDTMLFSPHFRVMWCLARWACRAGWLCVSIDNLSRACMNAVFLLSILEGHTLASMPFKHMTAN